MTSHVVPTARPNPAPIGNVRRVEGEGTIALEFPAHLSDESKLSGGSATALFFPRNEAEALSVLEYSRKRGLPVTISAARTGIVGGAVPTGGVVLSTERMNSLVGVGWDSVEELPPGRPAGPGGGLFWVRLQPGVTLSELNAVLGKILDAGLAELTSGAFERWRATKAALRYPVDPTEMSATVGGTVATNASGARSFGLGPTRAWVRRLRVALIDGRVIDARRGQHFSKDGEFWLVEGNSVATVVPVPRYPPPLVGKNAAGFFSAPPGEPVDLVDLFVGSEGTLGVVLEVDAWVLPVEPAISAALFFPSEEGALAFVESVRSDARVRPNFLEYVGPNGLDALRGVQEREGPGVLDVPPLPRDAAAVVFLEIPLREEVLERDVGALAEHVEACGGSLKNTWAGKEPRELARLKHLRHALPEWVNSTIAARKRGHSRLHKLGTDLAVPDGALSEMVRAYREELERHGLEHVLFGHVGDNHLHCNVLPRDEDELATAEALYREFCEMAVGLGGTVSAEHGVGKLKKEFLRLMFTAEEVEQMVRLKAAFDPAFLLNRGNVIDPPVDRAARSGAPPPAAGAHLPSVSPPARGRGTPGAPPPSDARAPPHSATPSAKDAPGTQPGRSNGSSTGPSARPRPLRVVVLVKQVPEADAVSIDPKTGTLVREGVASILNPFCEYALDHAVTLKEENPGRGIEVVVMSMGPPQARDALVRCLELGADRAILLSDRAFAGADCWATSLTLAAAIKRLVPDFDLVLAGKQAIDGDTAQVPPEVAEHLGVPQVTFATSVAVRGNRVRVRRETEYGHQVVEARLPALVSASKGSEVRRFPSLADVVAARHKDLEVVGLDRVGLRPDQVGLDGSLTQVVRVFAPPSRRGGELVVADDPDAAATRVVEFLRRVSHGSAAGGAARGDGNPTEENVGGDGGDRGAGARGAGVRQAGTEERGWH
ncbi:MAG: hypothetical protein Kow0069_13060 [Promethearchaeota archaeon]